MPFVIAELLVAQLGFAVTSTIDPLAGGLVMAITGSTGLAIYVIKKTGRRLSFRSLTPEMKIIVYRIAAGNVIINVGYVLGIHYLGLGAITTMTALGPLTVGARDLWARRWTRNGALHIGLRVIAILGVFVVNETWKAFSHFEPGMIIGLVCGVAGAWSFWNYVKVFFGNSIPQEEKMRTLAVADVLALPAIAITVWVASLAIGGGYASLSPRVLILGTVAGIFGFLLPTVLTGIASGKVSETVSSMLYLLDSPIAGLVGLAGAELGLLSVSQEPTHWTWLGTGIVTIAAFFVTLLDSRESRAAASSPQP